MSTAVTTTQVPAHIAALVAARKNEPSHSQAMDAILQGNKFPYPKVSIKAGRYRLVHDGQETIVGIELPVVIVRINPNNSKVFYSRPYDPNATDARPDCFSNDGLAPDPSVTAPVSKSCTTCPNNVLGSKITPSGAKSKICGDQRHIAVVPAADPTVVYALSIPVSGLKGLKEYMRELQNFGFTPEWVVTHLGFDPSTSFPKVTYQRGAFLSQKAIDKVKTLIAENETMLREVTREIPFTPRDQLAIEDDSDVPAQIEAPVQVAAAPPPPAAPVVEKAAPPPPVEVEDGEVNAGKAAMAAKLDSIFAD
jgi:hypothetical protein